MMSQPHTCLMKKIIQSKKGFKLLQKLMEDDNEPY